MAGIMGRVFQRLPTRELETRYRHEQRLRQAKFTRGMVLIAAGMTVAGWIANFVLLDAADAVVLVREQLAYFPILLVYAWFVGRPEYADGWWADVALFVVIQPIILNAIDRLMETGDSGIAFYSQLTYALQMVMAFACLAFAASVGAYLGLTLASVGYLLAVLTLRGYDSAIVIYSINSYGAFALVLFYINWSMDDKARRLFKKGSELDVERAKSDRLLDNILPGQVANRLKSNEVVADVYDDITCIFIDLVGFTTLSRKLGAQRIVELLNAFFSRADHATDLFGLEKVKTIGDAYMAVAGAITKPPRPEKAAVDFAIYLVHEAHAVGHQFGVDLRVHIGINSGPAFGGVISAKRISYDYWGDTINVAARLQDCASADGVTVSQSIHDAVVGAYAFKPPRTVVLKGLGETPIYDLDIALDEEP